jgi:hypothetical protein
MKINITKQRLMELADIRTEVNADDKIDDVVDMFDSMLDEANPQQSAINEAAKGIVKGDEAIATAYPVVKSFIA